MRSRNPTLRKPRRVGQPGLSVVRKGGPAPRKRSVQEISGQKVCDARFQFGGIVGPVTVDLPRLARKRDLVGCSPGVNGLMRFSESFIGADMESGRDFAGWSFGCEYLSRAFKRACDLNSEIDLHRHFSV